MVSGVLDCAGMLLAAAGILLVVGPMLVYTLFFRKMNTLPLVADTDAAFAQAGRQHWFFWAVYFTLVPVLAILLLWWRRNKTVIYNVDPEMFFPVLQQTLENLDFASTRTGNRLKIAAPALADHNAAERDSIALASPRNASVIRTGASAELEVEVFPPLFNGSLHWVAADDNVRAAVENELAHTLEGARTFDNPASAWLLGATGLMCGVMFLTGMVWVLINYLPPRH